MNRIVKLYHNGEEYYIDEYINDIIQTFDFQNDGQLGWSMTGTAQYLNYGYTSGVGFYAQCKSSGAAQEGKLTPPNSVYVGQLKKIVIYGYLPPSTFPSAIGLVTGANVYFRYRADNNNYNIAFYDGGRSGTYNLGDVSGEITMEINIETGRVYGTCGGVTYEINSSSANGLLTGWNNKNLNIHTVNWYHTSTVYIRKVTFISE